MTVNFQVKALPKNLFDTTINLTDAQLIKKCAKWIVVDEQPGYPCRVSLIDAKIGERVLALPFLYHDVASPYRASGPIFVREHATTASLDVNEIPTMLRHRLQSIRGYDSEGIMIAAEVLEGQALERGIERLFQNTQVKYIHIHNAKPGCFNCVVYRA